MHLEYRHFSASLISSQLPEYDQHSLIKPNKTRLKTDNNRVKSKETKKNMTNSPWDHPDPRPQLGNDWCLVKLGKSRAYSVDRSRPLAANQRRARTTR